MEDIKYSAKIEIKNVPAQWLPKIELFYPDLPGFPIMYVHVKENNEHIYGFPVTLIVKDYNSDNTCDIEFLFLSNKDLNQSNDYQKIIKQELENRIGLSQAISAEDILNACKFPKYKPFLGELFKISSNLYGKKLPYGRFFEEVYSIVRFVAAFQPKTGRQSEMRMLYNFLNAFGEKIEININAFPHWSFLEFYILPTYHDIQNKQIEDFPKFSQLLTAVTKIWELEFTKIVKLSNTTFHSLHKAWKRNEEEFKEQTLLPLVKNNSNNFSDKDMHQIERLVDAFNRLSWRASFFIWAICTIGDSDYYTWTKEFFETFYIKASKIKGCSEKVVACFLQQGFSNKEIIPIDTWIKTFYEFALGISSPEELFKSFNSLGKIERLIWLTSQANKTNIREYMELLWCQRFGINKNEELRGINPLACYECRLNYCCCGYQQIVNTPILFIETQKELSNAVKQKATENSCMFICVLNNGVPKQIYKQYEKKKNVDYILIDTFSGRILNKKHSIKLTQDIMTVQEFISLLPPFNYEDC